MQSPLQLAPWCAPLALSALIAHAPARAAECACAAASCATVNVDADNFTDLGCQREHIGRELPDSDADGIPDTCDACVCAANPPDPDTGVIPQCPERPSTAPGTEPEPLPPIRCDGGRLAGIPAHSDLFFVRPTSWVFTRFEAGSSQLVAGGQLLWLRNLDVERCEALDIGGVPSVKLTAPVRWYSRAALFLQVGTNLSDLAFDAAVGLKLGLDYAPPASWWSLGPNVHLATLFPAAEPTPLFVGAGPRIGLLDLFALTPFVQVDTLEAELSYGAWLELEWGVFEDLGLTRSTLGGLVGLPE